jgi:hypothetical protein
MMKRNYLIPAGLTLLFSAFVGSPMSAAEVTPMVQPGVIQSGPIQSGFIQPLSVESAARRAADQTAMRKWKMSLAPVFASQALDAASSFGMRELNPMLASSDGSFGAKGAGIKIGATAAILGVEYLIVRKHTRAAGIFSKINWSVSIVTTGFAAHNFAIR